MTATLFTVSPAKVTLKGMTRELNDDFESETPEDLLAMVTKLYSGVTTDHVTEAERFQFIEDIKHTKLATPLRFINFTFLLEDVTRAFTHQLVRYQIGISFVQESMRFVAKRNLRVFINSEHMDADDLYGVQTAMDVIESQYNLLIQNDIPIQDARAILPTNVLTNIWVSVNLQALQGIYTQRWCCQAQESEWRGILEQMKSQIEDVSPLLASFLQPQPAEICSKAFGASFDRPCSRLTPEATK